MKVVTTPSVDIALRTLGPESVRRVQAWFTRLEHWDTDASVRNNCYPLDEMPGVHVLRTTTDLRIFFRIDGDTVSILDVANKAAILSSGQASGVR